MKRFKFLTSLAFFAAIFLTSCGDVEPLDPAVIANSGGNNNGGGNGSPSGDYWPAAVNNQWFFDQNGTALPAMKMISTDNFSGATYYKFAPQSNGTANNVTTWLNKNSGVYTLKMGDATISAGGLSGTQTGYSMILFKDNIAVGQTWTGSYTQTTTYSGIPAITQTTNYTGTIMEKGVTVTVEGETFTDVIKMNMLQETSMMGSLSVTNTEYWFAKNVGPIKIVTYSGSGTYQSLLTNYTLF